MSPLPQAAVLLDLKGMVPLGALVPMLETSRGLAVAEPILEAAKRLGCGAVVYGDYDYCHEAQVWPFPATGEQAFWEPANVVIAAARRAALADPVGGAGADGVAAWPDAADSGSSASASASDRLCAPACGVWPIEPAGGWGWRRGP